MKVEVETDDLLEALSQSVTQLLLQDFFLGHIVGGLRRIKGKVSWPLVMHLRQGGFTMVVSESFLELSARDRRIALEHELLHLVFQHPERALPYLHRDPERFGLACDLVVNQHIHQGPLLEEMASIHHFDPPLPRDGTADQYYELLTSYCSGGASGRGGCGKLPNWASRCLGHGGQREGRDRQGGQSGKRSKVGLGPGSPNPWLAQLTPLAVQVAQTQLHDLLYAAMMMSGGLKCVGRFPGNIADALSQIVRLREGTLDWKSVLKRFAASSRKSSIKSTMRRRSKRYQTFPGIYVRRHQRLAICVDTSGSIGADELGRFFDEIDHIHRAQAVLEILEADVVVHQRYAYKGERPKAVLGRGGTSFDDALRSVRESHERFDACIYLTDGYAARPVVKPGCPLLWILSPEGTKEHVAGTGRVVKMNL